MGHEPFTWLRGLGSAEHVATSALVVGVILAFAAYVRPRLASAEAAATPESRLTARSVAEAFVEAMTGLVESVVGEHAERYVPLLGSFFIFILLANLIGLIPGFTPPTADFNITFGLGAVPFLAYNVYGAREHGVKYLKHFLGPIALLAPLMLVVDVFSNLFRPVSLGIRLFANMFADHQVVEIFTSLTKFGVPVVFYVLGAFVAVVQAFVFTMLSAIYLALAVSHAEH